ncbi:MAG: hypothetical protein H6581_15320 [Bacteroidia bacterium]|nr:hypothetical protein [Bacteroidia bacterium]
MKSKIACLFPLAFFLLWLSFGCGDRVQFDGELTTTLDNSYASNEFAAIRNMVDLEASLDPSVNKNGIYCPNSTIVVTQPSGKTVMTIDFGSGSVCLDGRLRSGKLVCTFDGKWGQEGTQVTIVPQSYNVDNWAVYFTKTITRLPRNGNGNQEFEVVVDDATLTNVNGTIHWNTQYIVEWIAGEDTPFVATDNEYLIDGTADGVARSNLPFSAVTTTPLRVKLDCSHIKAGILTITPQNFPERSLDYGTGDCDNQALFKVGDYEQVITLP